MFISAQMFGVGSGLVELFQSLEGNRPQVITAGLVTAIIGAIAAYVLIAHLLGAAQPLRAIDASAAVLLSFLCFLSGQIATLITFGEQSPWGSIVKGISGPLTDGFLNGIASSAWWPVPFVIGVLITLFVARWLWDKVKEHGLDQ